MSHKLPKSAAAVVGLAATVALAIGLHGKVRTFRTNASSIKVSSPSLAASVLGSRCAIEYRSANGETAGIDLAQTFWEFPVMIVTATNSSCFFCIYYNDIDLQLIKFYPDRPFRRLARDNPIRPEILRATCEVERVPKGNTNDWTFAANALKGLLNKQFESQSIPLLDLILYKRYFNRAELTRSMINFGNQGQYTGDVY